MKDHTITLTAQQLAYLRDTIERRIEVIRYNYRNSKQGYAPTEQLDELLSILVQA